MRMLQLISAAGWQQAGSHVARQISGASFDRQGSCRRQARQS